MHIFTRALTGPAASLGHGSGALRMGRGQAGRRTSSKHGIDFVAALDASTGRRQPWLRDDRRELWREPRSAPTVTLDGRSARARRSRRAATLVRIISLRKANRREQAAYAAGYVSRR